MAAVAYRPYTANKSARARVAPKPKVPPHIMATPSGPKVPAGYPTGGAPIGFYGPGTDVEIQRAMGLSPADPFGTTPLAGTGIPPSGPGSHGAVGDPGTRPAAPGGGHGPGGTGAGGGGGGAPPAGGGDPYASDPIYQQIVGLANANVQQASAAATAARKQVAIELGDPNLAHSLGLGSLVEQTAQANPFSSLKSLLRSHNSNVEQTNRSLNQANLYSSSTRERGLQQEQLGYQGGIAGAAGSAQHELTTILAGLLSAQQGAAEQRAQAAADAYERAKAEKPLPPDATPTASKPPTVGGGKVTPLPKVKRPPGRAPHHPPARPKPKPRRH
jgi:hypothetical protein